MSDLRKLRRGIQRQLHQLINSTKTDVLYKLEASITEEVKEDLPGDDATEVELCDFTVDFLKSEVYWGCAGRDSRWMLCSTPRWCVCVCVTQRPLRIIYTTSDKFSAAWENTASNWDQPSASCLKERFATLEKDSRSSHRIWQQWWHLKRKSLA